VTRVDHAHSISIVDARAEYHSGPLPPPDVLIRYSEVNPTLVATIVTWADEGLERERAMESRRVDLIEGTSLSMIDELREARLHRQRMDWVRHLLAVALFFGAAALAVFVPSPAPAVTFLQIAMIVIAAATEVLALWRSFRDSDKPDESK